MRIIGGTFSGRVLKVPPHHITRPMTERCRETLFDILTQSQDFITGKVVLDAFCGSGSLGLECLSRGARRAVFMDKSHNAINCLRENIQSLQLTQNHTAQNHTDPNPTAQNSKAQSSTDPKPTSQNSKAQNSTPRNSTDSKPIAQKPIALKRDLLHCGSPPKEVAGKCGLFFISPPWAEVELYPKCLSRLAEHHWLAPDALGVIDSDSHLEIALPEHFGVFKQKVVGDHRLMFVSYNGLK